MHTAFEANCAADLMVMGVPGANHICQLIVKVSYRISGNALVPSKTQIPVWSQEAVHGGRVYGHDYQFPKEKVDLVVVGDAVAPGEEPTDQVEVSISVGGFNRKLLAIGDRYWRTKREGAAASATPPAVGDLRYLQAQLDEGLPMPPNLEPPKAPEDEGDEDENPEEDDKPDKEYEASSPARFKRIRLDWDRSYGGDYQGQPSQDNPAGKGYILPPKDKGEQPQVGGVQLPNIEDPANRIKSWKSMPGPVGCNFYPQLWGMRMRKGLNNRGSQVPCVLPAMYNQAHPDFELDAFPDGQEVVIKGMIPVGEVRFTIDKPNIETRIEHPDMRGTVPLDLVWDLVCIRPETSEVYMVGRKPFKYYPQVDGRSTLRVLET